MRAGILLCLAATFALHAADEPSPEETARIAGAIEKLASNDFAERQAANLELQKFGTLARAQLLKAGSTDAEVKKSVGALLDLLPPERERLALQAGWKADEIKKTAARLYEEWEAEQKRLAALDDRPIGFHGEFKSNLYVIQRDFAMLFRYRPDIVLDGMQDLRAAHPEESLAFKNQSTVKLSPARFLASFHPRNPADHANRISMIFNGAQLGDVMFTLLVQGQLRMFVEPEVPKNWYEHAVTLRIEDAPVEQALAAIVEKVPELEFVLEGRGENRYIVLRKKAAK